MSNNIYTSDWHIHTNASYDAELKIEDLLRCADEIGITELGISDHVNYPFMYAHLKKSREQFVEHQREGFHFGVELTTIPIYEYEYAMTHPVNDKPGESWFPGYRHPGTTFPDPIALPLTEEELRSLKVEYVIGAAHWAFNAPNERRAIIDEYQRQNMFVATDARVNIVGHPWWFYSEFWVDKDGRLTQGPWFDDFNYIPQEYHEEFAAALIENGKCVELNTDFFTSGSYTEKFKIQYAEYMRWLFEKGVPVAIGSDIHGEYIDVQDKVAEYLRPVGFSAADFSAPRFRTYE